jgi:hypothetical protein
LLDPLAALLGVGDRVRVVASRLDTSVQHRALPVSHWFERAIARCDGATAHLREPLVALQAALHWRQNPTYSNAEFLERYGYCELLGPAGHLHDASIALGLLLLAPRVTYPAHAHAARETYAVVAGRAQWQQGDRTWRERAPGARIEHAPYEPHAMRTADEPLLAAYLWHDHLNESARLTS